MKESEQLVQALLENEHVDPKEFLAQHTDLGFDRAFVSRGWAVRGPDEYGKVNSENDVRWIVYIQQTQENDAAYSAYFSGEKRVETASGQFWWKDFEIDGEIALKPGQTVDDFVGEIEDYLCDKTGPDHDPDQEAYNDHFGYEDRDR